MYNLYISVIILYISGVIGESSIHTHNGQECFEENAMVDTRGCPSSSGYDPYYCSGTLLRYPGNIWTKEVDNVRLNTTMSIEFVLAQTMFKESMSLPYRVRMWGSNDRGSSHGWTELQDKTSVMELACQENRKFCTRYPVYTEHSVVYPYYMISFNFENLTTEDTSGMRLLMFNFKFTNCSEEALAMKSGSTPIVRSVGFIAGMSIGAGLLVFFSVLVAMKVLRRRGSISSNDSDDFNDISPSIIEESHKTEESVSLLILPEREEEVFTPMTTEEVIIPAFSPEFIKALDMKPISTSTTTTTPSVKARPLMEVPFMVSSK